MKQAIPQDKKEWMLKTAWKKLTLQEIALQTNVNVSTISLLYKSHGIEPMKKRDIIASKILDLYNDQNNKLTIQGLTEMLNCSDGLIKEIVKEFNLDIPVREYKYKETGKTLTIKERKMKAATEHDRRIEEINLARASFTSYTQSGSDLNDSVHGINTTLRPKTYLTNEKNI